MCQRAHITRVDYPTDDTCATVHVRHATTVRNTRALPTPGHTRPRVYRIRPSGSQPPRAPVVILKTYRAHEGQGSSGALQFTKSTCDVHLLLNSATLLVSLSSLAPGAPTQDGGHALLFTTPRQIKRLHTTALRYFCSCYIFLDAIANSSWISSVEI